MVIEEKHKICEFTRNHVVQRSPPFLAPGTSFMEDSFSMDRGGGGEGGVVQAVMGAMGSGGERQMKQIGRAHV